MSQSLVKNYIHIIFSTKHRQSVILPAFEEELYTYIGGICKNLECFPVAVGGHLDHIHILCLLSKNISLVKLVGELKANSSKWFKTTDEGLKNFYWQNGYGAFSVAPYKINKVNSYIINQKQHHQNKTFQDEYKTFLNKYDVKFDERYIWD